jgi:glycosyltransferase involved in cell wall biosynthesis
MPNGCLPVARHHSRTSEVIGNAGIFLDNDDIAQTAKVLIQIFQESEKDKFVLQNGLKQVSKFSWSKTAYKTISNFKILLKKI